MTRIIIYLFINLIVFVNAHSQISESSFHYLFSNEIIIDEKSDNFQVKLSTDGENYVTWAEKTYFLRFFLGDNVYENLENIEIDSQAICANISNLNKDRNFYYDQLIDLNKERKSYNCLAIFSNLNKDTLYFPTRFYTLYAILEAQNITGQWKPIQYCYNHSVGDHSEEIKLLPNYSLLIPFSKDLGSRTAQMRLKLHGNDTIYISKVFEGKIDEDDFIIPNTLIQEYDESDLFLYKPIFKNLPWKTEFEFSKFIEE